MLPEQSPDISTTLLAFSTGSRNGISKHFSVWNRLCSKISHQLTARFNRDHFDNLSSTHRYQLIDHVYRNANMVWYHSDNIANVNVFDPASKMPRSEPLRLTTLVYT